MRRAEHAAYGTRAVADGALGSDPELADENGVEMIAVLLAELPPRLADAATATVAAHPDLTLVGVGRGVVEVLLRAAEADVVVVAADGVALPAIAEVIVDEYPWIGVVGIDVRTGRDIVYRLRPAPDDEDAAAPGLADAIRWAGPGTRDAATLITKETP